MKKGGKVEIRREGALCGEKGPGPKYPLKTLVGYQDHCLSKLRGPAFTFGRRQVSGIDCDVPGPKYVLPDEKRGGFSIGYAAHSFDNSCGPGPKYQLPDSRGLAFSIKSRTPHRSGDGTPGPYDLKSPIPGPAFSIGSRAFRSKCAEGPGPGEPSSLDAIRPRAPAFSIGYRQRQGISCDTPGPKYNPKLPRISPEFSFGLRHHECARPYIVECDEQ